MIMLNFLKRAVLKLLQAVLGGILAVLYGIGMVLYIVFMCVCRLISATCVFWIFIWLWMPWPFWLRIVAVVVAYLIVAIVIDIVYGINKKG